VRFPVPGLRWHKGLRARAVLEEFFYRHLPTKRRDGGDDLFTALCQAETDDGHRFTDEDVVNHMIFVLMAAHDTTTITLTTMADYLAKFPQWQERLRAESLAVGRPQLEFGDLDTLAGLGILHQWLLRYRWNVPGRYTWPLDTTSLPSPKDRLPVRLERVP
jgi:Cytochrome P450